MVSEPMIIVRYNNRKRCKSSALTAIPSIPDQFVTVCMESKYIFHIVKEERKKRRAYYEIMDAVIAYREN